MIIHPQFDPVAIQLGPVSIHWYGFMYLLGFISFLTLGNYRIKRCAVCITPELLDELLLYGAVGVVLGGRLGEVLFYQPGYYLSHLLEILMVWHGGMSFHGGFVGVLISVALFTRKHDLSFWAVTDFIAPLIPPGLAAGRIGNFINGELWGRVADPELAWAMRFPKAKMYDLRQAQESSDLMETLIQYGGLPRHPSQLYECVLEGVALFALLWWVSSKACTRGRVSALFLIGYGLSRFGCEFFRAPDAGIFDQFCVISMGQWLSLPMIIIGLMVFYLCGRSKAF